MAKLGVITDGISTDFDHALKIMSENELNQATYKSYPSVSH